MKKELKHHKTPKTGKQAMNLSNSYEKSTQGRFQMIDQKTEVTSSAFSRTPRKQRMVTLCAGSNFQNPSHQFSEMLRNKLAESLTPIAPVKKIDPTTIAVPEFSSPLEKQIFVLGIKIRKAKKMGHYLPREVFTALRLKKPDLLAWAIKEVDSFLATPKGEKKRA